MKETGETPAPSHEPERPQGLVYEPAFITEETERDIITMLDERGWVRPRGEALVRVQSFGFHYHGMTHEITVPLHQSKVPEPLRSVAETLARRWPEHWHRTPNQARAIEYRGASQLEPHVDHHALGPTIATLSLARSDAMIFERRSTKEPPRMVHLERRSVLMLTGEARNDWMHGFRPDDGADTKESEGRRISVTFRDVANEWRADA